jgi:pilus assembly protein CpaC
MRAAFRFFALVCACQFSLFGWPGQPAPRACAQPLFRDLSLQVGEQTSLSAEGVKSYSEGVPGIVEVRLPRDGGHFVLLALRPGKTTLLLFMHDGREQQVRIEVVANAPEPGGIVVEAADNIRLDLYFAQVRADYGHQLGVAFRDSLGGSIALSGSLNLRTGSLGEASLGIAEQVLPRLDMAQRSGWARVQRHAAVIAQNGKQAQFQSGGELNVRIQGALTVDVRAITYGSRVSVEPRFDKDSGRIELRVGAELADLADDGGTGVPGRQISRLDTVVNLDLGKSLVLAGLDGKSDTRSRTGLPGLSAIPILGGLFGTFNRSEQQTKNLVFIVPTVVQAVSARERNLIEEMLHVYQRFDGDLSQVELLAHAPRAQAP